MFMFTFHVVKWTVGWNLLDLFSNKSNCCAIIVIIKNIFRLITFGSGTVSSRRSAKFFQPYLGVCVTSLQALSLVFPGG